MEVIEAIHSRRSCRSFKDKEIDEKYIDQMINAGIMAPSGKNGQPWRVKIIKETSLIRKIAALSIYRKWLKGAKCMMVVYLEKSKSYNYLKDTMAIGAFMQNILLAATSMSIGSCWIGELMNKELEINELIDVDDKKYKFMGIIALGYSSVNETEYFRHSIQEVKL